MRVVYYGRYSSKEQNPLSIRDQLACCDDYVAKQPGWIVVGTFTDAAQTGRDDITREGWQAMQRAAQAGESTSFSPTTCHACRAAPRS